MTKPMQRIVGCVLAAVLMLTLAVPVLPASAAEATEEAPSEETTQEVTTEAMEEQTEAVTVTPTDAPTEVETEAPTVAQTETPTEPPTERKTEAPTEPPALPFEESETVDGVTVTVCAETGVFPEGAALSVTRIEGKTEDKISKAIQTESGGEQNVALSYAFDIKVLDADGEVLQPADGASVTVSFKMNEVADCNLSTQVYHVSETSGKLVAEQLDTTEDGSTVTAETDGFSYYTVEFTYDSMQYVMDGDSSIPLSDVLDFVGLTGVVTEVSVSNDELFSVHGEAGTWMVYAHQPFFSEEWMQVTINGVRYEIVVTDASDGTYNDWSYSASPSNDSNYVKHKSGGVWYGMNGHIIRYSNKTYRAYCLNRQRGSTGTASSPDTDHIFATNSGVAAVVVKALLLAPGNGYSCSHVSRLFGNSDISNDKMYIQAAQIAIWHLLEYGTDGAGTSVNAWKMNATNTHSPDIVSLANNMVKAACALQSTAPSVNASITKTTRGLSNRVYEVTITTNATCYGGYTATFSNLPSGSTIAKVSSSKGTGTISISGTTVTGTTTFSSPAKTDVIRITIPNVSSTGTQATMTVSSFVRVGSATYLKATSNGSKQNMAAVTAQGKAASKTLKLDIPAVHVGKISINKEDYETGAKIVGAVFRLYEYSNSQSQYVATNTYATTGSNGYAYFTNLTCTPENSGRFRVVEVSVPEGYERDGYFYATVNLYGGGWNYRSSYTQFVNESNANGPDSGVKQNLVFDKSGYTTVTRTYAPLNAGMPTPHSGAMSGGKVFIMSGSKNSTDTIDLTVRVLNKREDLNRFTLTIDKRGLDTNRAVNGAVYGLYRHTSSGWAQTAKSAVSDGALTFANLDPSVSDNGQFRVVELSMNSETHRRDEGFEVLFNPGTGAWSYTSSFTGSPAGTAITGTATGASVTASVRLPDGTNQNRTILSTSRSADVDWARWSFHLYQYDAPKTSQKLTVSKIVPNPEESGEPWAVSGVTFQLQRQTGTDSWQSVGNLIADSSSAGTYTIPRDSNGNWSYTMTEGASYRVAEVSAPAGVVNSGWTSPVFVWRSGQNLDMHYTAEDSLPKGHIGLCKVDSETNAPIAGIAFSLTVRTDVISAVGGYSHTWYQAGDVVATGTTDASGRILWEGLPYGTYTVTELSHPINYAYETVSFAVTVGAPAGYSGSTVYADAQIGFAAYPSGMTVITESGKRYVRVENTPLHPDMAVSKLTERTTSPSGNAVTYDAAAGRYTEDKVPGTYFNGQSAKFTVTVTNTGDVDLYGLALRDVFSDALWLVVRQYEDRGVRTTDVTWRQVNSSPLALGSELAVDSTITTRLGRRATVTGVRYYDVDDPTYDDDLPHSYELEIDRLAAGDALQVQLSFTLYNYPNRNLESLPNDVYLYASYMANGTKGSMLEVPGGGEGDCRDVDRLNVVSQGKVTIHKRSADGTVLSNVHFELLNANGQKVSFVRQSNGDYAATVKQSNGDWVTASASGQTTTTDLVTDSNGTVTITELPEGTYSLVETRTVSGQTLLKSPVSIVMPTVKSGAEINLEGNVYFGNTNHFYALDYTITNSAQFRLPATGGSGHLPAVLFGLLILSGLFLTLKIHHRKGDVPYEKTACACARNPVSVYHPAHPLAGRRCAYH